MSMLDARANMIENQIRAGGVSRQQVFNAIDTLQREDFVPVSFRDFAYADMEIPLACGENMLTPLTEARILQAVAPEKNSRILEIGTGSGYMAALLAHGAGNVTTVEIEPALYDMATRNLSRSGIDNVQLICGNGFDIEKYAKKQLFDIIIFSGAVFSVPDSFLHHLADNGKIMAFKDNISLVQAVLMQKETDGKPHNRILFETFVKSLREQPYHSQFHF